MEQKPKKEDWVIRSLNWLRSRFGERGAKPIDASKRYDIGEL